MHKLMRFKLLHPHNMARLETLISIVICFVMFTGQAAAVTRLLDRSLYVNDNTPGATTSYTVSFNYHTITTVGSIDMQFCYDPIPNDACVTPTGLDVSRATLSAQTGETGYSITTQSTNNIVLSRTPSMVGSEASSYTLSGVVNPTDTSQSFSIRLSDYASSDASGPLIDLGSVVSQIETPLTLQTQVPPILLFCLAQQVSDDCSQSSGGNYSDLGDLDPNNTLTASSQMAAGTNASSGYVITVNGSTMAAGTHNIAPLATPTVSIPGTNQFGINLVANTDPQIGSDPDGASTNTTVASDYNIPNKYTYNDGAMVASAPNVSLVRRYTVSYIVNSAASLTPGVYTTTLTFICSGLF